MSVLVTGFEPFGGAALNASAQIVAELAVRTLPGLATRVLPTSYQRAEQALTRAMLELQPRLLLMLGLHAGSTQLRFEQVALNLNDSPKPDNDGEQRLRLPIHTAGPVSYLSSLDFDSMRELAAHHGEELVISRDAGGYVCNHAFYTAAHWAATQLPTARVGFVHVPPIDSAQRCTRIADLVCEWVAAQRVDGTTGSRGY